MLIDFPRAAQDVLEQDPDDRLSYMVSSPPGQFLLGNQRLPQPDGPPPALGEPRLYDGQLDGKPLRIVAMDVQYGDSSPRQILRVQVGKGLAVQQRAFAGMEGRCEPEAALCLVERERLAAEQDRACRR